MIVWITGLAGAGKTSLARMLTLALRAQGRAVVLLDGDDLREILGAAAGDKAAYTRSGRIALAMRYARLAQVLREQGLLVVVATISLFRDVLRWNRENLPDYFEVYLDVPMSELRRRDQKALYSGFDRGEHTDIAGLDIAIDTPDNPDWAPSFDPARDVGSLADELLSRMLMRQRR